MWKEASGRKKLGWVVATIVTSYAVVVFILTKAWYHDQMVEPFHFFNDLAEWKQLDKVAHVFGTFNVCVFVCRTFKWGGLKENIPIGALIGFLIVSTIEVMDGFSAGYGASLFDLIANALGGTLFFVQHKIWGRIKLFNKFSFHFTSFAALRPSLLGDGFLQEIIKDYNGQTFWYSWSLEKKWWPSFLSIAVGLGAEGMVYGRDEQNALHHFSPYRKFYLSLDLNPTFFQSKKTWAQVMIYPLTLFKCPAPAIEFSMQGVRFHWLYF
jgi:hypothetical protein